jgi:hypothetical protein
MESPTFDLSKPPHPQIIDLFVPFIPGFFFEISMFMADPELLNSSRLLGLGQYSRVALFIFGAYFCGLTAMVISTFLLRGISQLYRILHLYVVRRLRMFEVRIMHERPSNTEAHKGIRYRFASSLQKRRMRIEHSYKTISSVWVVSAMRLLDYRFGINALEVQFTSEQLDAWRAVLGTPTEPEIRGSSLVRALGASGWAGLLARHIAWPLHHFHYLTFCVTLIVLTTFNSLSITQAWMSPVRASLFLTRNVLREIAEMDTTVPEHDKKSQ